MAVLSGLKPEKVFEYFEEICAIPHPSYEEKAISDYLVGFAKEHKLTYYQDELYNVIMIKEASAGYENVEPIIIQGHMDMVCEQESDCSKDMHTEGLDLYIDGDFVKAKGTTLGGDDGIAVAMALAILDDDSLKHPKLEFICTVSEEVGMEGAAGIDLSHVKGSRLLNLDSEEEGVFLAGCAGGSHVEIKLEVQRVEVEKQIVSIDIDNLAGGHSGTEIHKGHANANILMNRLLTAVEGYNLISFAGGSKDNAITRKCSAEIAVLPGNAEAVEEILLAEAESIASEYAITDPNMEIEIGVLEAQKKVDALDETTSQWVVSLINALPNGVIAMSQDIPGLTETSLNLGITKLEEGQLSLVYSLRSNVDSALAALSRRVESIATAFGAKLIQGGEYPAWEFLRVSPLREQMVKLYKDMYGVEPKVEIMHAGVECGLLSAKKPGLDCVSMGPALYDIHTPSERMSISSVERVYEFVTRLIEMK